MKRLGKIRYEFGTGIAMSAIWQDSDLLWFLECLEVAGEEAGF